jgi:hypothetical protein
MGALGWGIGPSLSLYPQISQCLAVEGITRLRLRDPCDMGYIHHHTVLRCVILSY